MCYKLKMKLNLDFLFSSLKYGLKIKQIVSIK